MALIYPYNFKASKNDLNEVVVVGYGTQKRISITGAVDKIGSSEIKDRPVANLTQALQGTSPGLVIQQRTFQPVSGAYNINIRGLGTTNNNDPLIIIDGISGGDLNLVNPSDIESVSVLKDAGSAAIFMVPVPQTAFCWLPPNKEEKTPNPPLLSGVFMEFKLRVLPSNRYPAGKMPSIKIFLSLIQGSLHNIRMHKSRNSNNRGARRPWEQQTLVKSAPQQTYNVSVSGGGQNSSYLLSVGYFNQASMLIGQDFGAQRWSNVR